MKKKWIFIVSFDKESALKEFKTEHPDKKLIDIMQGIKIKDSQYSFAEFKFRITFLPLKSQGTCCYCKKKIYDERCAFWKLKKVHPSCYDLARGKTKLRENKYEEYY